MHNLSRIAVIAALGLSAPVVAVPSFAQAAKGDYTYEYSIPSQARAIPSLKAWLDSGAATERGAMAKDAAADHRDASKTGRTFNPYQATRKWQVVTDTPRFLSLSLESWAFTGGAHGNTSYDSVVWDKATRQRRTALSFFTGKPAFVAAVRAPFCARLDAERRRKRAGYGDAGGGGPSEFDSCIAPTDGAVILGSSDRRLFDRIGFLIPPYAAGPYAEGSYEVTVPVTPAVIRAVRPELRRYFAIGR